MGDHGNSGIKSTSEYLWEIYPDALDCGISPEAFWNYSLNEILDIIESYARRTERKRKQKIIEDFVLIKALTLNIATVISGKGDLCNPWDFYPDTFKEEKKEHEQKKLEAELTEYREKRRQWAEEFNRRRQGI